MARGRNRRDPVARSNSRVAGRAKAAASKTIKLSDDAHALVCGLVQGSEDVNQDGVIGPVEAWDEVREKFPLKGFLARAEDPKSDVEYIENAGF